MSDFDPARNLELVALKEGWKGHDARDDADWITEAIGDDGSIRVRPLTLVDVLDWVERESRGDVS